MESYSDLQERCERMESRIKRLTLLRELMLAEIEEILVGAQADLDGIKLQLQAERYEGKHLESDGESYHRHKREDDK